ncbi:hypothetical protein [Methylobacillus sp.]|uniref:hypothetical protein n=1 Tax=Methylobacillus sp. TaxID=56818 RepID=UPI0012CF2BCA|nr:hypothetical protein [Methylobacillus sp.]MPS49033.1 hypothetical protein [Methylobacillus sp.]
MSQYPVHVTASELIEGIAKSSGNPYKMVRIQGVLEVGEDRQIFRTVLPSGSEKPAPGRYMAQFEPRVNNQTMELGGGITKLVPVAPGK